MKTLLLFFIPLTLYSQSPKYNIGFGFNQFYDVQGDAGHFSSSYKNGTAIAAGITFDSIANNWLPLTLALQLEHFGGSFLLSDGGQGSSSTTNAKLYKTVISFSVFPFHFNIRKKWKINLGFDASLLLHEKWSGNNSGYVLGQASWNTDLSKVYHKLSMPATLGFRARLARDVWHTANFIISPQYSFYLGMTHELNIFPNVTKSMRHNLGICIRKR
ncbi:MAG: hypothetical protein IPN29_20860 [Saprospiraceae bacterium]|nr:hypothetical protein [Saprospiraceae bacterium]